MENPIGTVDEQVEVSGRERYFEAYEIREASSADAFCSVAATETGPGW